MYLKNMNLLLGKNRNGVKSGMSDLISLTPCNLYSITCIMGLIAIKKIIHCYFPKLDNLYIIQIIRFCISDIH